MEANAREQQRNQEAESSWVRRNVWGVTEQPTSGDSESEKMGHTILGDIIVPQPPQAQPSNVPTIAALAALLGVTGLGTYLLTRPTQHPEPPAVVVPDYDDESLSIGLGRIEDYVRPAEPVQ